MLFRAHYSETEGPYVSTVFFFFMLFRAHYSETEGPYDSTAQWVDSTQNVHQVVRERYNHPTISMRYNVILAYVIVCTRHNSCSGFAGKCCKTFFSLSSVNHIHDLYKF